MCEYHFFLKQQYRREMHYRLNLNLLVSFVCFARNSIYVDGYDPELESHLELGGQLLSQGHYDDALSHYHAAVDADPYNYLTYFKRATVYMAIGRVTSALKDLTKVIELRPDFISARLQRGTLLFKQGKLDEAHIDFEGVLRLDPLNPDAQHTYAVIEPMKREIRMVYGMVADHNYPAAIDTLTRLLQELPWDIKLRELRSRCFEAVGDLIGSISDLRVVVKSGTENQERYLKLSELYYEMGETDESLNAIRECLRFDPDHKACFAHYKNVKKIAAHLKAIQDFINERQYGECAERARKVMPLENKTARIMLHIRSKLCFCLNKDNQPAEAIKACTEALNIGPNDYDMLCERADAHLANENYSEAVQDFQKAININENMMRAHEGLKKAQKLHKLSKKRDYYKILGVKKTAGKREILKAYRKMAQKWHPDNFQGDEKASAEKKFIDIAAAKEVLTDPEKRQKYDNGEDPLDPETQAGQNFNPFGPGFHPFGHGGGPFTFKFHFS